MISCVIETKRFNETLSGLHDALIGAGQSGDAANMIADESRKFGRMVINLTPPPGLGLSACEVGQNAVKRDMGKLFTAVDSEMLNVIGSEHGVANVDTWRTGKDGKRYHIKWDRIDPSGAGMSDFHRNNRDRRGRAYKKNRNIEGTWHAAYVVAKEDYLARLRKISSRVGMRKAGWAVSVKALGGNVPAWIAKHAGAPGVCNNQLHITNHPSVTMVNYAPGIRNDQHTVESALNVRLRAIGRRMRLILSGYNADIRRGMRPRKYRQRELEAA